MADNTLRSRSRLAESAYQSPYSSAGAPGPHPNGDPYASLRSQALSTLEAMGYDPKTMVERGVVWAEDQDPFGHVMHTQYMHFFGQCFYRVMESYDEFLSEQEYDDMINAKTVIPVIRRYSLDIRKQVKYPDSLIAAYRQELIEPTRNTGITSLFSLKQQAIVAEVKGSVTYMDVKTGRPVDIRTLSGGWPAVYDGFSKNSKRSKVLKEKWEMEHHKSKI
ncbi:hypothetical protein GL218_02688 [Daldinia childiae]|uniref:uncharacterized protein n=1 Tax=Daldinia childiae TaxID=326645 RepID=UPI001444C624|nr:uncharacterized protein GL218_02688 [Daldinia childiae]KAF3065380.1 hypothetical protein GL218_02688 [Daldinia childiae]